MAEREDNVQREPGGPSEAGSGPLKGLRQQWTSLLQRSGDLVERVASSAREVRGARLKQALAASERGDLDAAFGLLQEALREKPDDTAAAVAFWDVAVASERAADAVPAITSAIRARALEGELELAAQYWIELTNVVPDTFSDPATLLRILPVLPDAQGEQPESESARDETESGSPDGTTALAGDGTDYVARALRQIVDPANSGLTPGLALRVLHIARDLNHLSVALLAAHRALESDALHEAKRVRIEQFILEFEESRAGARSSAREHPLQATSPSEPGLSDEAAAELAARLPPSKQQSLPEPAAATAVEVAAVQPARAPAEVRPKAATSGERTGLTVLEGAPVSVEDDVLVVEIRGGRRTRIEYKKIQAVAVALVGGLADEPVVLIDLLLDWRGTGQRRAVRFRTDEFDATELIEGETDDAAALREFLGEILQRSGAVPLPDPDSALGLLFLEFEDLKSYEREVLRVGS